MDKIQTLVKQTFPSMEMSKCETVVKMIVEAGVVEEGDLQWLAADDIKEVLPPVQVRKLLCAIQQKCGMLYIINITVYCRDLYWFLVSVYALVMLLFGLSLAGCSYVFCAPTWALQSSNARLVVSHTY